MWWYVFCRASQCTLAEGDEDTLDEAKERAFNAYVRIYGYEGARATVAIEGMDDEEWQMDVSNNDLTWKETTVARHEQRGGQ